MVGFALVMMLTACGPTYKMRRLSDTEFDHYYALRVYMEDQQRKEYLRIKTEEERNTFLEDSGLWERFYQYPPHIREKIVAGEVQVGWDRQMVYMAWGRPVSRRKLPGRHAERSELLIYRFEQQADRSVLVWEKGSKTMYKAVRTFVRELKVDDDKVAQIDEKDDAW